MPRTKQFDRDQVLQQAMELFWEKGYHDTSVQDLISRLGINRASMYDTFGDKYQLFQEALKRYRTESADVLQKLQYAPGQLQNQLRVFLYSSIDRNINDPQQKGCFLVNTTIDLASRDTVTCKEVNTNMKRFVDTFENIFAQAQKAGELRSDMSAKALARYLFNTISGINVIARSDSQKELLQDVVEATLKVFERP